SPCPQILRLEQRLLLLRTIRTQDRQRVDQTLVARAVDAIPISTEIVGDQIVAQRGEQARPVDILFAKAGPEVAGKIPKANLASAERLVSYDIMQNREPGDAVERDHPPAVIALAESGNAPDATDAPQGKGLAGRRLTIACLRRRLHDAD